MSAKGQSLPFISSSTPPTMMVAGAPRPNEGLPSRTG